MFLRGSGVLGRFQVRIRGDILKSTWVLFAWYLFCSGLDRYEFGSGRVPGPVPHPGFQKQRFVQNVGLLWGGTGPIFPAQSRRCWGSPGGPGVQGSSSMCF